MVLKHLSLDYKRLICILLSIFLVSIHSFLLYLQDVYLLFTTISS